jgi:hypothetical protein
MSDKQERPKLITPVFRGSFVHLVTPHKIDKDDAEEEPKYDITIVLEKDDPEAQKFVKRLEAAINAAMIEKNGKPIPKGAMKHYPIKDGDEQENEDFNGKWLITARNKFKPDCIDRKGQKLFNEEQLYSGAWYRASIDLYAWSHPKFGKGVSINLKAVLKERDDTASTYSREIVRNPP